MLVPRPMGVTDQAQNESMSVFLLLPFINSINRFTCSHRSVLRLMTNPKAAMCTSQDSLLEAAKTDTNDHATHPGWKAVFNYKRASCPTEMATVANVEPRTNTKIFKIPLYRKQYLILRDMRSSTKNLIAEILLTYSKSS